MALETKYGLAELTGGTSKERALEVFVAACNKIDTLFITDSWFASRDAKLRQLLSDPITGEQAEALLDAVLKRQRLDYLLDHVIEWLEHTCDMSWRKFTEHKEQLDAVERMYQEEDLLQKHIEWLEELKAMPRPTCPTCDSTDQVVPIFYDLPETLHPPADLYVLGECGVLPDSPGWHCKECSTAILNTGVENPGWPSSGLLGDDSRRL